MTFKFTSVPTKTLASSITESATSFQLNNIIGWDTVTNLTSTDFGTQAYCIFRNAARTRIELMQFDATTIASASITITRRGLAFTGDILTETTAYKLAWTKGDTYVDLGTDTPQMLQLLKEYIDAASIVGAVDASTTAKGIVEVATQAEADAGTATGGTGASLIVTPATLRSQNYNDYVADTGAANAYVVTPIPAITAYAAGQIFTFKATNANTGASTINVSGLGVKSIVKQSTVALSSNDIIANQVVTICYDGTNFQLISALFQVSPTVQSFTASGTYTKPANLKYVVVEVQAAGGGGGGAASASGQSSGGGGGGGFSRKVIPASSVGATETVTIGAAGTGGIGNVNGTAGAVSSFGSHASATGGGGGINSGSTRVGGSGGIGSLGDLNISGGGGIPGIYLSADDGVGGTGGSSFFGGGGTGTFNGNGGVGGAFGGGGAGAADTTSVNRVGGDGGAGRVIVTEYY